MNRGTTLTTQPLTLPAADLGAENPLPVFRDPQRDLSIPSDPGVPAEIRGRLGRGVGYRVLPYRLQDGYSRHQLPRTFQSVVLENEILRATFLPELGGRLVSLLHKSARRELLDCNPVFQPANLAIRNAWFSGGIEWNAGQFGHHCLTCSPVFAARVESPEGYPVLRLYEWDRMKCFPWQIDFHLPPDSEFLFARVRLVNPLDHDLPMYWWTNIAVPESDDVRVLAPATAALHYMLGTALTQIDLPAWHGVDASYPARLRYAQEFFCCVPDARRKWIAALDRDGGGFVETSTRRLVGRKLWAWGRGPGGQRWQEYLSRPGRAYIEIQAGLATTQLETVPMPPHAEWTWTEAFGFLQADAGKVHSPRWTEAIDAAESALAGRLSERELEKWDEQFAATTNSVSAEIIASGSGWGALERRRKPGSIPAALQFEDSTLGPDQAPWLALLETNSLPEGEPGKWMVEPEWQRLLEASLAAGRSGHWLAWLHLGVMRMENGDAAGAVEAWLHSLTHKATSWAFRNLAVAARRKNDPDTAETMMSEAWTAGPRHAALAVEFLDLLVARERWVDIDAFLRALPPGMGDHERIHIAAARSALAQGRIEETEALFAREFAMIRESETSLTDLWFECEARKIVRKKGGELDDALRKRVRRELSPPRQIDFRMKEEA